MRLDHLLSKEEEVCTEHLASRKARLVRRHIAEHSKAMKEQLSIVEGSRRGKSREWNIERMWVLLARLKRTHSVNYDTRFERTSPSIKCFAKRGEQA